MLDHALTTSILLFGLALVPVLLRLVRGPALADRILALDTLYVIGLCLMVLLGLQSSGSGERSVYFEVALLIAVLGFVSTVAAARFLARDDVIE